MRESQRRAMVSRYTIDDYFAGKKPREPEPPRRWTGAKDAGRYLQGLCGLVPKVPHEGGRVHRILGGFEDEGATA